MIRYVEGDATRPDTTPAVIAHVCNDVGAWGRGFVRAVSARWREPERAFRSAPGVLGDARIVQVERAVWVANIIGQRGLARPGAPAPVRYDAIREGLGRVAVFARAVGASVHMPRIGCGLAGGRWSEMAPIVESTLEGLLVTVYTRGRFNP